MTSLLRRIKAGWYMGGRSGWAIVTRLALPGNSNSRAGIEIMARSDAPPNFWSNSYSFVVSSVFFSFLFVRKWYRDSMANTKTSDWNSSVAWKCDFVARIRLSMNSHYCAVSWKILKFIIYVVIFKSVTYIVSIKTII